MTDKGALDPRYRINVPAGTRVMIKEEETADLIPGYIKKVITKDAMHEMGIMVLCEDGHTGRVQHIGTETSYMQPMDLITNLETKLRKLIVNELSRGCPEWWEIKINPTIREEVTKNMQKGYRQVQQIPNYSPIEETYFLDLSTIIRANSNWKNYFRKIFHDRTALEVKMFELSLCRNTLAHSKKATKHMERKIRVYYDDIISLIERYCRQTRRSK